jgi:uncharacterized protein YjbJ (UPF0337 family)
MVADGLSSQSGQYSKMEEPMKISRKDRAKGLFHQAKGSAKEVAGKISGNSRLEAKGAGEKNAGKVQEKIGQVEKVLDL